MVFSDNITSILHPISVHFPIALTITAFFLAIIYVIRKRDPFLNPTIRIIFILGVAAMWAAIITSSFTPQLSGEAAVIRHYHHNFANLTVWIGTISGSIYLIIQVYKKQKLPPWLGWIGFLLMVAASVLIGITGYYGGYIIYNVLL
ncbi:MAG: hypothetical protein Q4F97_08875 [Bacteroidales bacterium]|nr:hypothetical protein [Bacteroidales bacterium]